MYKISIDFDRVTYEWDYKWNCVEDSTYDCNGIPGSVREYEANELTADVVESALRDSFFDVMGDARDARDPIQILDSCKFSLDRFEDENGIVNIESGKYFVIYEAYVKVTKDGEDVTDLLGELIHSGLKGFYR